MYVKVYFQNGNDLENLFLASKLAESTIFKENDKKLLFWSKIIFGQPTKRNFELKNANIAL